MFGGPVHLPVVPVEDPAYWRMMTMEIDRLKARDGLYLVVCLKGPVRLARSAFDALWLAFDAFRHARQTQDGRVRIVHLGTDERADCRAMALWWRALGWLPIT